MQPYFTYTITNKYSLIDLHLLLHTYIYTIILHIRLLYIIVHTLSWYELSSCFSCCRYCVILLWKRSERILICSNTLYVVLVFSQVMVSLHGYTIIMPRQYIRYFYILITATLLSIIVFADMTRYTSYRGIA